MDADAYYRMDHSNRGVCHIFYYEDYEYQPKLHRPSADYDAKRCSAAFGKIGFKISMHKNLTTSNLWSALNEVGETDHAKSDALVVVFMGHGKSEDGKEMLKTYDSSIPATDLCKPFEGHKCRTLIGKPKMFFIQACRGKSTDLGVTREIDSGTGEAATKSITLPNHADLLVMWATFTGMPAFKHGVGNQPQARGIKNPTDLKGQRIEGSVFIHFLTKIIEDEGSKYCLSQLLQKVTRKVAEEYNAPEGIRNIPAGTKQLPHLQSTMTKEVFFHTGATMAMD